MSSPYHFTPAVGSKKPCVQYSDQIPFTLASVNTGVHPEAALSNAAVQY